MVLIYEDTSKRIIKDRERVNFSSFSSLHLIVITARVKGKKQISNSATDDEDLTVKIDNKSFPKLSRPERIADSAAAFSGGSLHGLTKTVHFLIFLKGKDHKIELTTDKLPNTAALESLRVYTLYQERELFLKLEQQAEDGNRRPWITIVLDDLSLKSITATITYSRRKRDSDDVKIIIDDKVQGNLLKKIKHFLWRYVGSLLSPLATKTETNSITVNLPIGLHYLEFWADRMPTLNSLIFDFGTAPLILTEIPTVNNPAWAAAIQVVSGKTPDPTKGANHFYATIIPKPSWADEKKLTIQVGITKFYKL